jgi:hypothetical protein
MPIVRWPAAIHPWSRFADRVGVGVPYRSPAPAPPRVRSPLLGSDPGSVLRHPPRSAYLLPRLLRRCQPDVGLAHPPLSLLRPLQPPQRSCDALLGLLAVLPVLAHAHPPLSIVGWTLLAGRCPFPLPAVQRPWAIAVVNVPNKSIISSTSALPNRVRSVMIVVGTPVVSHPPVGAPPQPHYPVAII